MVTQQTKFYFLMIVCVLLATNVYSQSSNNGFPLWNPQNDSIVFLSNRSGRPDIWLFESANAKLSNLTSKFNVYLPYDFRWSNDGKALMFVDTSETEEDIFVLTAGNLENLTKTLDLPASRPSWNPSDKFIVFEGGKLPITNLYMLNTDDKKISQLTYSDTTKLKPVWINNEEFLYIEGLGTKSELKIFNIDNQSNLPFIEGNVTNFDVSPTKTKLIKYFENTFALYDIASVESHNKILLNLPLPISDMHITWNQEETMFVLEASCPLSTSESLYLFNIINYSLRSLLPCGGTSKLNPDWSSVTGKIVYEDNGQIWVVTLDEVPSMIVGN